MKRKELDRNKLTPMLVQYMEIKDQYEDVILMFRLGDFYEMFFEDAKTAARELELVLTGKSAGLEERIPMCGVPHHAVNNYLEKLIALGYKVALCEQVEDPKTVKGVVKREVTQVVSKGTIMNSDLLDEKNNNYIGNVFDFEHCYVISYADISTGEFNTIMLPHQQELLNSEILTIGLKEVIVTSDFSLPLKTLWEKKFQLGVTIYNECNEYNEYKGLYKDINDMRYLSTIKHLLTYLHNTQKRCLMHLQPVIIRNAKTYLKMDINTKRNLELVENMRLKERTYSLLWLLDKTKTAMGSRLLKQWLLNPLVDKDKIKARYDMVAVLLKEFILKAELVELLKAIYDLERLSGRIAYGNANGRDLIQLRNSLKVLPELKNIIKGLGFNLKIDTFESIYKLLEESIYEEPPFVLKEGNLIKKGYHEGLDELKANRRGNKDFIIKLEQEERARLGIKNLKVGFNRVFGYYIEVTKSNVGLIPEDGTYERKQTLANAERYITPLLKEKEALILGAEEKIINLEYELFIAIRDKIKAVIPILQANAQVIAKLDVLQALATVTETNNYVRPLITEERIIKIKGSRHPILEQVMNTEFVPNDIIMGEQTNILLITGPNMAGKSTYMRQLALIVVMAQIGCFVPCQRAELPIFNQIFTRIGASDDLVGGESTFMVEMTEANYALQEATSHSLILFDELGRGTATYDGMSLAQAIIEYIHQKLGAKTLFATHYHELTNLEKVLPGLKNIHVRALEEDGNLTFLHKIKAGAITKSYGIQVAKLANLPSSLIKRAALILKEHESEVKPETYEQLTIALSNETLPETSAVEASLKEIDPLTTTPLEALTILFNLKEMLKSKNKD